MRSTTSCTRRCPGRSACSQIKSQGQLSSPGLALFAFVYVGFAVAPSSWAVWPLLALYGVYIAATEGVAKAWVADVVPRGAAGTAYGLFSAASGAALLVASVVAGLLWSRVSPVAPFLLGAAAALSALLMVVVTRATSPSLFRTTRVGAS